MLTSRSPSTLDRSQTTDRGLWKSARSNAALAMAAASGADPPASRTMVSPVLLVTTTPSRWLTT